MRAAVAGNWRERLRLLLTITQAHGIARRYAVVNGFDGALTMVGLLSGFEASGAVAPALVVNACIGTALALAASGVSSAYVSEAAERRKELRALERAMVADLRESAHGHASRRVPFVIALVNGVSPLIISLIIIAPLWLASRGVAWVGNPVHVAMGVAFVLIFLLGVFLGRVGHIFWLWAGLRAVLVAAATAGLILLLR